ncbi:MAG: isoprenylcysteine carboxylmethyltransferase family protein [Deltaproteobacteria bacterium]|jgi:protein-S-isoprenylcysteine O-methyltransferase Ste14|nr:isoprenylcysteine carboxylmethyltransferase family protein [Deltaproteobacteria bacterium]MDX9762616.1 isoprenylcysteine carboxylmethyltransferase family protein [Desulfomonilia bacterium]
MNNSRKIWYRLRGALLVPFYLFIVFRFSGKFDNHVVIIPLGSFLFGLGLLLRIWAQTHLHYRLKEHKKKLTLTGPYVYVRNPIYIGNTLILASLTVLTGLLWFIPAMILACAFTYHMTVLYEESHLKEKYGQGYVEFTRRVPRWLPRLRSLRREPSDSFQKYLYPSILAELHILLLLLPLFLKMIIMRMIR